jgi:hypothetical protein
MQLVRTADRSQGCDQGAAQAHRVRLAVTISPKDGGLDCKLNFNCVADSDSVHAHPMNNLWP